MQPHWNTSAFLYNGIFYLLVYTFSFIYFLIAMICWSISTGPLCLWAVRLLDPSVQGTCRTQCEELRIQLFPGKIASPNQTHYWVSQISKELLVGNLAKIILSKNHAGICCMALQLHNTSQYATLAGWQMGRSDHWWVLNLHMFFPHWRRQWCKQFWKLSYFQVCWFQL